VSEANKKATSKKATKQSKAEPVAEKPENSSEVENDSTFAAEMEELKRDMRSAQLVDWMQSNQQTLIGAAVALVLLLAGGSLWLESNKSQKESAAVLYHQALSAADLDGKRAMFELVIKDYGNTGYGALAHLYMAKISDHPEEHLNALIHGSSTTQELAWQARLDLAELHIANGKADAARAALAQPVGKQYEQLRHYLMAELSSDSAEKKKHLQMSLDAPSNDALLKSRVERQLSALTASAS